MTSVPPALLISPDALGLGVGGRAAEHAPEHLERRVDPALLIDGRRAIALDAGDEEDHEDALAAAAQDLLPAAGLLSARLCHAAINIDRSPRLGNSADSNALVRNPLPIRCPKDARFNPIRVDSRALAKTSTLSHFHHRSTALACKVACRLKVSPTPFGGFKSLLVHFSGESGEFTSLFDRASETERSGGLLDLALDDAVNGA
jgi:hypothetical protein